MITPGYFGTLMKYDWSRYDTTSVKCILYGGGKIAEELVKMADEKIKCTKMNSYGMTEAMVVHDSRTINTPGSNGTLFPGVKTKVSSGNHHIYHFIIH